MLDQGSDPRLSPDEDRREVSGHALGVISTHAPANLGGRRHQPTGLALVTGQ